MCQFEKAVTPDDAIEKIHFIELLIQQHEKSYGMGMNMTLQCKNTPQCKNLYAMYSAVHHERALQSFQLCHYLTYINSTP